MIRVSHHGKLYVLGEYSVMETGQHAVIIPVKQKITGLITASNQTEIITSYGVFRPNEVPHIDLKFVQFAYATAMSYLTLKGVEHRSFTLSIESTLDEDNLKYGFGSSGCVVVAVIAAIMAHHYLELDQLTLFKLSVYTQYKMDALSSGGDIAVAVYGVPLVYSRYDFQALKDDIQCVEETWEFLMIRPIQLDLHYLVGWTKTPQSSQKALDKVKLARSEHPQEYFGLLEKAESIVKRFIEEPMNRLEMIDAYRVWMCEFQRWSGQLIETDSLTTLINSAHKYGYHAKVSGAGGGDCGIAFSNDATHQEALKDEWKQKGIQYVNV